jgi:hypothetical protein
MGQWGAERFKSRYEFLTTNQPHNLMHWQKAWFLVIVMLF